ncbi:MAG: ATPase, T2SS/T4P/T4SS family, partial [Acidimicrobiia bacterium]
MSELIVEESLVRDLRARVADDLVSHARGAVSETGARLRNDDERMLARHLLNRELERLAATALADGRTPLPPTDEEALTRAVLDRLFELGRLQPLLDDDRIQNITANGCDRVFVDYADGTKMPGPPIAETDDELVELLREIGRRHGLSEREFNPGRPSLNLQLPDGSRLFAVAWVCDRPAVAIRRHRFMKVTLTDLVHLGAIDVRLQHFLAAAVRARKTIIVAGATGAGKTTMLRGLAAEIPEDERIVTI